jgi:hypothetical protein
MQSDFKFPVSYNKKMTLEKNIIEDLELVKLNNYNTGDRKEYVDDDSIYGKIFQPDNAMSRMALVEMAKDYSYDKHFLKDTQQIIKQYRGVCTVDLDNVLKEWNDIKNTKNFKDYYIYYNWNLIEKLNNNDTALQFLTIYTIASPMFSLCVPIFIMIVPFLIIKLRGFTLSFSEYYKIFVSLLQNHSIGRALTSFSKADTNQKAYLIFSILFYLFSIYQNILACLRFIKNIKKIHNCLFLMKTYLQMATANMQSFMDLAIKYKTYIAFYNDLKFNKEILNDYLIELEKVSPLKYSIKKIFQLGHVMNQFYQLYNNEKYNKAIIYSFYFTGYAANIERFAKLKLPKCKFSKETVFTGMFYPSLINTSHVKNDISLKKMIITGPNASGKTTILKTVIINVILSQQFGYGCYKSANINLYKFIHCYLNIPDTSGRDSLFQAEARRCKEIIDCINKNKKENHFCIFDELYSGTNPEEAVMSANAFMKYLSLNENVHCLLTTHYIELCDLLKKFVENYKMETICKKDTFEYTYKLLPGISKVKGGIKILNDMNYPKEIMDFA